MNPRCKAPRQLVCPHCVNAICIPDCSAPASPVSAPSLSLSVMSYNILAPCYCSPLFFPIAKEEYLGWPHRRNLIHEEIRAFRPDIIGFQELEQEHYGDDFTSELGDTYASEYHKRTFIKTDGCGTFYNKSRFVCLGVREIEYNDVAERAPIKTTRDTGAKFLTNNVGHILLLKGIEDPYLPFFVVNTHLYWNPKYAEVKLMQASFIMEALETYIAEVAGESFPIVFVGDFNSLPNSAVYSKGYVSHKEQAKLGLSTAPPIKHDLSLKSAYSHIKEPQTNITHKFSGCLDYIWFTPSSLTLRYILASHSRSTCLFEQEEEEEWFLPNDRHPSDHLPLLAVFQLKHDVL